MSLSIFFFILITIRYGEFYSIGAPDSACIFMQPGHGFDPQPADTSPFELNVDKTSVAPGDFIRLTLSSKIEFKGFMIQARNASDPELRLGSFETETNEDSVTYMTCGKGIHNSVTHRNSEPKTKISVKWFAPSDANFGDKFVFRYSGLTDYDKYWARLDSIEISVGTETTTTTTTTVSTTTTTASTITFTESEEILATIIPKEESIPLEISTTTTTTTSTTTTSTTTTTTMTTAAKTIIDQEHPIYEGCGKTKSCFGIPENCVNTKSCESLLTYEPQALNVKFTMLGKTSGYLAMGLSSDTRMGDDLTSSCFYDFSGDKVDVQSGYNDGYSNSVLNPSKVGIEEFSGWYEDGFLYCTFQRPGEFSIPEVSDSSYDLFRNQYVLLLATGPVINGVMERHTFKLSSGSPAPFGVPQTLAPKSRLYIYLHGSFMIGAWIFLASLGTLVARYYKGPSPLWFHTHRSLMMAVLGLTVAGFILIFLEFDFTWTAVPLNENPHAVLGCVSGGLCLLQPFIAILRCNPDSSSRPWFNWIHWFVGNLAHFAGIVAIFFAVDLEKAQLPKETDWLLLAFVGFHLLIHIILSFISCASDNKTDDPRQRVRTPYPDYDELKKNKNSGGSSNTSKVFMFVFYVFVNGLVTAALILLVIFAPASKYLRDIGLLP